ncbi:MAG: PQQ-binding-like beta-propeller repeat protein [Clostridia bacterium]|nr:PQQ-binding-like beta-propeller repeat protein [Clostridia bacterium]
MKKFFLISLGVILFLLFVVVLLWFFVPRKIPNVLISSNYSKTNSNNYIRNENFLDKSDDCVAIWNTRLFIPCITVWEKDGARRTVYGVNKFMLDNGYLYYLDGNSLYRMSIDTGASDVVMDPVYDFYVHNNNLVYISGVEGRFLFQNFSTGQKKEIAEDVYCFWVNGDLIYYVGETNRELVVYSLNTGVVDSFNTSYTVNPYYDDLYFYEDTVVHFDDISDSINILNLNSFQEKDISLFGEPIPDQNHIRIAVNDKYLYLSFQKRNSSGSVVWNVSDLETNGLWCIDLESGEKKRISEKTFDSLFVTDSHLFGITPLQELYSVDLKTFIVTKE